MASDTRRWHRCCGKCDHLDNAKVQSCPGSSNHWPVATVSATMKLHGLGLSVVGEYGGYNELAMHPPNDQMSMHFPCSETTLVNTKHSMSHIISLVTTKFIFPGFIAIAAFHTFYDAVTRRTSLVCDASPPFPLCLYNSLSLERLPKLLK